MTTYECAGEGGQWHGDMGGDTTLTGLAVAPGSVGASLGSPSASSSAGKEHIGIRGCRRSE